MRFIVMAFKTVVYLYSYVFLFFFFLGQNLGRLDQQNVFFLVAHLNIRTTLQSYGNHGTLNRYE